MVENCTSDQAGGVLLVLWKESFSRVTHGFEMTSVPETVTAASGRECFNGVHVSLKEGYSEIFGAFWPCQPAAVRCG